MAESVVLRLGPFFSVSDFLHCVLRACVFLSVDFFVPFRACGCFCFCGFCSLGDFDNL